MEIVPQKRCVRCGETKPLSEFNANQKSLDGYWNRCRLCIRHRNIPDAEYFKNIKAGLLYCFKCNQWKQPDLFVRNKNGYLGRGSRCVLCHRVASNDYAARNRPKMLATGNAWRRANRERHLETQRIWRAAHPERVRATNRRFYQKNVAAMRERSRIYYRKRVPLSARAIYQSECGQGERRCTKCGEIKPHSDFYRVLGSCKSCVLASAKAYKLRNKTREVIPTPAFRCCARCGEYKSGDEFIRDTSAASGLYSYCKSCSYAWSREYRKRNRAHVLRLQRASKTRTARHIYEYNRRYRLEHPEWVKVYEQGYRQRHPEKFREYGRAWRQRNPHAAACYVHARRARIRLNGGRYTVAEWLALCEHYDHRCLACGLQEPEIKLTVDHVIPVSHGGANVIGNIQPLCGPCNSSKGARHIDYRPVASEV